MDAELQVLGPVTVRNGDRSQLLRGALKCRLVGRLALTPDRKVDSAALIDAMWGDHPPRTARQSLHVHISHLRDSLDRIGAGELIRTVDRGYELGIDESQVDAWHFSALVESAGAALSRGDVRGAHDQLIDALDLWGEPFIDLADHPVAAAERQRLILVHERAQDDLNEARLSTGDRAAAITALGAIVAERPLRDRPYHQLMRAHADSGETTEALAVFELAQEEFERALGAPPSAELASLAQSIRERRAAPAERDDPLVDELWAALDDPGSAVLVRLPAELDLQKAIADLRNRAAQHLRPFAHARVPETDLAPLSPLVELAGLELDGDRTAHGGRRQEVFNRITAGVESRLGIGAMLVIDAVERSPDALVDYFASAFGPSARPPFTALLIARGDGDAFERLARTCRRTVVPQVDGGTPVPRDGVGVLNDDDRELLQTLRLATRPAPVELVIRASGLETRVALDAISRLSALGLAAQSAGGRLDLVGSPDADDADDEAARRRHSRIVRALGRVLPPMDSYRVVAEAKHRLAALPLGDEEQAWAAAAAAAAHLDSLGAYEEVTALVDVTGRPGFPLEGSGSDDPKLALTVILGRAQIRTGMVDAGRATLYRAIDYARERGRPALFAEAVRALVEERAPQVSSDALRALEREALELLPDERSETRVQLMTDLANSVYLENPAAAASMAHDAVTLARRSESGATIARALTGLIQAKIRPDNPAERLELALEAQEHARRSESIETLVLALTYEASALVELGHLRRAGPPLRYAEALAADVQVPRFRWWAAAWQALLRFALGEAADPEAEFRAAYELWPSSTGTDAFECFASQITCHRLLEGRGPEMVDLMVQTSETASAPAYRGPTALAQAQSGDLDGAAVTLAPLFDHGGLADLEDATLTTALATATEAAYLCGLTDVGPFLVALLEPLASIHSVLNMWGGGGFYWGSLAHALGLAHELAGNDNDALAMLDRAASDMADAGALPFARRSQEAAQRLRARGAGVSPRP